MLTIKLNLTVLNAALKGSVVHDAAYDLFQLHIVHIFPHLDIAKAVCGVDADITIGTVDLDVIAVVRIVIHQNSQPLVQVGQGGPAAAAGNQLFAEIFPYFLFALFQALIRRILEVHKIVIYQLVHVLIGQFGFHKDSSNVSIFARGDTVRENVLASNIFYDNAAPVAAMGLTDPGSHLREDQQQSGQNKHVNQVGPHAFKNDRQGDIRALVTNDVDIQAYGRGNQSH